MGDTGTGDPGNDRRASGRGCDDDWIATYPLGVRQGVELAGQHRPDDAVAAAAASEVDDAGQAFLVDVQVRVERVTRDREYAVIGLVISFHRYSSSPSAFSRTTRSFTTRARERRAIRKTS